MKKIKAAVGDLFVLPWDSKRPGWGIGQVLSKQHGVYIVIFEPVYPTPPASSPEALGAPALAGLTIDASIKDGEWPLIGHALPASVEIPALYGMVVGEERWVEDFSGLNVRPARSEAERSLPPRRSYSPSVFEHVLAALHGEQPWTEAMNDLLVGGHPQPQTTLVEADIVHASWRQPQRPPIGADTMASAPLSDSDLAIVKAMREEGDNPEIKRLVDVFFFGQEEAVKALAAHLQGLGFEDVSVGDADESKDDELSSEWMLSAKTMRSVTAADIEELNRFAASMEETFDVEFDGWGAEVEVARR